MESSFRDEEPHPQKDSENILLRLPILASIIKWLAGLINWTEEELEDAGIYLDRLGGE